MTEVKRNLAADLATFGAVASKIVEFFASWRHAIHRASEAEGILRDVAPFAHRLPPEIERRVKEVVGDESD